MYVHPGPIELLCDAPPYAVVQACVSVGFRSPADVRWIRLNEVPSHAGHWRGLFSSLRRHLFGGARQPAARTCSCGQGLPALQRRMAFFHRGEEVTYRMGQCERCRTMYWHET